MTKLINTRTGKIVRKPKSQIIKDSPCTNCVVHAMCKTVCHPTRSFITNEKILIKEDDEVWNVLLRARYYIRNDNDPNYIVNIILERIDHEQSL